METDRLIVHSPENLRSQFWHLFQDILDVSLLKAKHLSLCNMLFQLMLNLILELLDIGIITNANNYAESVFS